MLEETASLLLHLGSGRYACPNPPPTATEERTSSSPNAKLSISFLLETAPLPPSDTTITKLEDPDRSPKRKAAAELGRSNLASTFSPTSTDSLNKRPRYRYESSFSSSPQCPTPSAMVTPCLPAFPQVGAFPSSLVELYKAFSAQAPALSGASFFPGASLPSQPAFFLLPNPYFTHTQFHPFLPPLPHPQQPNPHLNPQQLHPHPHPHKHPHLQQQQQQHWPYPPTEPTTPPGLSSSSSSPPSSPLLSSTPSSPVLATTPVASLTVPQRPHYSGVLAGSRSVLRSLARAGTSAAPQPTLPVANVDAEPANKPLDVQQHTQQLLKQWHRQRQVQKLLYLQQKKHRQQQQEQQNEEIILCGPGQRPRKLSLSSKLIAPVPTFSSAVAGQPSSLPAETLMALVEDLLTRYVGQNPPATTATQASDNEKECGKRRHRVPPEHLQVLEEVFAAEPFPHAEAKNTLAERLGMTKRSITIWFQNKRARLKRSDDETSAASSSSVGSAPAAPSAAGKSEGIVFHQLTVDTAGQLAIIPEFPLER